MERIQLWTCIGQGCAISDLFVGAEKIGFMRTGNDSSYLRKPPSSNRTRRFVNLDASWIPCGPGPECSSCLI